jgi:hypothetical protein
MSCGDLPFFSASSLLTRFNLELAMNVVIPRVKWTGVLHPPSRGKTAGRSRHPKGPEHFPLVQSRMLLRMIPSLAGVRRQRALFGTLTPRARTLGRDSLSDMQTQVGVAHGQRQHAQRGSVIRHMEEAEVIVSITPGSYQRHHTASEDKTQPQL